MDFVLRTCRPGDETALSLVARATILETYAGLSEGEDIYAYLTQALDEDEFHQWFAREDARVWCVEATPGRTAIGYALVHSGPTAELELERLYVLYRFHGLGLGKSLMDEAITFAREKAYEGLVLRVHERNAPAIAFYERFGFSIVGDEPFHAGKREYRVLVMRKSLAG